MSRKPANPRHITQNGCKYLKKLKESNPRHREKPQSQHTQKQYRHNSIDLLELQERVLNVEAEIKVLEITRTLQIYEGASYCSRIDSENMTVGEYNEVIEKANKVKNTDEQLKFLKDDLIFLQDELKKSLIQREIKAGVAYG